MRHIKAIYLLLAAVITLTACKNDDDTTTALYSDAAITSFTLGTLNRYVDGVKSTYTGSSYTFHINQVPQTDASGNLYRLIENTDSLPTDTDLEHVICTLTTRNNGVAVIQDIDSDVLRYYSSSDSIDFRQERTFYVYASDNSGYTKYTIKVNMHKEDGETFVWNPVEGVTFPNDDPLPAGIKQLLGSSKNEASGKSETYGLSDDDKLMVSYDEGATWQQDLDDSDDDAGMLPTQHAALVSYPMNLAENTDYVLLAGVSNANSSRSVVWRKIVDYTDGAPAGEWTYIERSDNDLYNLLVMQDLTLVRYDDSVLAFGGDYTKIYQSRDNGITWKENKKFQMPQELINDAANITSMKVRVDEENNILLYCYGINKVWKGRLNRLGWEVKSDE